MKLKAIREAEVIENTLMHFPDEISKEIHNYVIEDALQDSRYIFTTRSGKQQYGYCTHCEEEHETNGLKHKEQTMCKKCRSICYVQSAGMGRKHMKDEAHIVYYEKSEVNDEAVIARTFEVSMDYSGDYKNVRPKFLTLGKYLFEMGNPVFLKKDIWHKEEVWELRKTVFTLFAEYSAYGMPTTRTQEVSEASIRKAVAGTPFQYSVWNERDVDIYDDYVRYFALYAKHPQIEYLSKLGFKSIVEKKVNNEPLGRIINWNGKTLDKVLKIPRQNLKEVIQVARVVDENVLKMYQDTREIAPKVTIEDVIDFKADGMHTEWQSIMTTIKNKGFVSLINYLKKQRDENGLMSMRAAYVRLLDYWKGCQELELVPGDDIAEYPTNVVQSHNSVYEQIKFKADEILDRKIKERIKELSKYEYENSMFMLRPFESTKEIIAEGKELKHCVGSYSKDYANGRRDLFAIRRKDKPDEPYYTLEIKKGKVRQYYGYDNNLEKPKDKDVVEFVETFEKEILKTKGDAVA